MMTDRNLVNIPNTMKNNTEGPSTHIIHSIIIYLVPDSGSENDTEYESSDTQGSIK
jgi:hypothetical protein